LPGGSICQCEWADNQGSGTAAKVTEFTRCAIGW
jgi:hypothetical protein